MHIYLSPANLPYMYIFAVFSSAIAFWLSDAQSQLGVAKDKNDW